MDLSWFHHHQPLIRTACCAAALAILALGSLTFAQEAQPKPPSPQPASPGPAPAPVQTPETHPGHHASYLPPGVQVVSDLRYGEAPGVANLLDIYLPENPQEVMPLVIWVHGGGWEGGDKVDHYVIDPMIRRMIPRGYVIASINYRVLHEAVFPAQIYDCKGALRWLRAHAAEYHIDPNRIGIAGLSAGGHLVALMGTSGDVKEIEGTVGGNLDQSSAVQAVCDDCGPTDISLFFAQADHRNVFVPSPDTSCLAVLLGGGPIANHKAMAARANPITYVTNRSPPFLLIHGDHDSFVPWQQSQILADALKAVGVECHFELIKNLDHALAEMMPHILNMRDEFFDRHLHPARPVKPAKD